MKTVKAAKPGERKRDWSHFRDMWIRVLEKQTGKGLSYWNARVRKETFADARDLEAWLAQHRVTGYAQQLLIMEQFGYPDFFTATADELINAQYADRRHLWPIYEAIVAAVRDLGEFVIQARKGYVSLLTPRRTFARVQATTKDRVDLGLRIDGKKPGGRLQPSRIHETMQLQISLAAPDDVDAEVLAWLKKAYFQNC